MARKPKPIVMPVVISDRGMVFSEDEGANGRLRAQFAAAAKSFPRGPAELELRPFEETRRARANAYLWAVPYKLIAAESGYSADEVHELMKIRHNSTRIVDPSTGEEIRVGQSTAKLSVQDFSDFIERVLVDAAEWWGIVCPEPNSSQDFRGKDEKVPA